MKTILTLSMIAGCFFALVGCRKGPCNDLAKQVCEMAPGSPACDRATRLTAKDECASYLKNVKQYVDLTNLTVETPGVQPPKPPEPAPAPAPAAAADVPAPAPAAAPTPAPAATAPATNK